MIADELPIKLNSRNDMSKPRAALPDHGFRFAMFGPDRASDGLLRACMASWVVTQMKY